jgi:hypothetical protein
MPALPSAAAWGFRIYLQIKYSRAFRQEMMEIAIWGNPVKLTVRLFKPDEQFVEAMEPEVNGVDDSAQPAMIRNITCRR